MFNTSEHVATARRARLAKIAAGCAMIVAGLAAIAWVPMRLSGDRHRKFMGKAPVNAARRMFTPWFLKNPIHRSKFNDEIQDFRSEFKTPEGFHNMLCEAYDGIDIPNQKACCPKHCGSYCGTEECHKGEGGERDCCEGQMKDFCSVHQSAPCWLNITKLAEVFEDESCVKFKGIDNPTADACCHPQCGEFCGDDDCHQGPGGREHCCKHAMKKTCGDGVDAPCLLPRRDEMAPFDLTYTEPKVYSWGDSVTLLPKLEGRKPTKWYASPRLPDGLQLDTSSGKITGQLSKPFDTDNVYHITAEDGSVHDWTTYDLRFSVLPPALTYSSADTDVTAGQKVNIAPDSSPLGSTCSINPALPDGLVLDKATCAVTGTLTEDQTALDKKFVITAKNEAGETTSGFTLKVAALETSPVTSTSTPSTSTSSSTPETSTSTSTPKPVTTKPATTTELHKPKTLHYVSHGAIAMGTSVDMMPVTKGRGSLSSIKCTIKPELPDGLKLDSETCEIHGTLDTDAPTGEQKYVVTATNAAGSTSSDFTISTACSSFESFSRGGKVSYPSKLTGEPSLSIYTIKPSLPEGLKLNNATGEIHGALKKDQEKEDLKYLLTENSKAGIRTCKVTLSVTEAKVFPWWILFLLLLILLIICLYFTCQNSGGSYPYTALHQEPAASPAPPGRHQAPVATSPAVQQASSAERSVSPVEMTQPLQKQKSNWRDDKPAPEEEDAAIAKGVPVKSVERAKDFIIKSTSPTQFAAQPAAPEVRLTWRLPGGGERTVIAKRKPLGLTFPLDSLPITINRDPRPGSEGAKIGVKEGWSLIKINDTPLQSDASFYEVDTMLHTVLGMLPN